MLDGHTIFPMFGFPRNQNGADKKCRNRQAKEIRAKKANLYVEERIKTSQRVASVRNVFDMEPKIPQMHVLCLCKRGYAHVQYAFGVCKKDQAQKRAIEGKPFAKYAIFMICDK